MNNRHYWVFHGYIGTECAFALHAFNRINETVEKLRAPYPSEELTQQFWYSIGAFLTSYGNISKAFYPPSPPRDGKLSKFIVNKRGQELKAILGLDEPSLFADREMRNDFEHFDERIDEWFYLSKDHRLVDSSIVPESLLTQYSPEDTLRNYVLRDFVEGKYVLKFTTREVDLNDVVDAIKKLKTSLDQHQPNFTDGEYVAPTPDKASG